MSIIVMGCREIVELLCDYIENDLDDEVCRCIERHLEECEACKRLYQSYEEVIKLCHELLGRECITYNKKEELLKFLREKLNVKEV